MDSTPTKSPTLLKTEAGLWPCTAAADWQAGSHAQPGPMGTRGGGLNGPQALTRMQEKRADRSLAGWTVSIMGAVYWGWRVKVEHVMRVGPLVSWRIRSTQESQWQWEL